jgi:hypothetical protein
MKARAVVTSPPEFLHYRKKPVKVIHDTTESHTRQIEARISFWVRGISPTLPRSGWFKTPKPVSNRPNFWTMKDALRPRQSFTAKDLIRGIQPELRVHRLFSGQP